MIDPYIDPKSAILRNKFGLTDQASLNRAETSAAMGRSMLLRLNPLKGDFDSARLKAIHFYLFQDVYDWAGQFRTVPLAKAGLVGGGGITSEYSLRGWRCGNDGASDGRDYRQRPHSASGKDNQLF